MLRSICRAFVRPHRRAPRHVRIRRPELHVVCIESLEPRTLLSGVNPNEIIDTTPTPAQLAQALVGPGVSVSNVTFTGGAASTGSFDFTDPTVVGFSQGILMSSGSAVDVVGPNLSDSNSTDFTLPGDADLDALSGFTTFDAAVLEFDFEPSANQVVFMYAFASDEYPEWVNTPYNDVFAFFVNGTNYAQVRQIAGDPAAPFVPVAINNINNGNALYPDFIPARPDLFRANYFDANGPSVIDLELDGITSVLTFQAPVNPGVSNHMKLAIADASDGIYDSAVFIQAGSLVSNENPVADLSLVPSTGAAPLDVTAIIEGEDPNGLPLTYIIDWGDGTVDSTGPLDLPLNAPEKTALVNHTYATAGTFFVTLTVSNGTLVGTSVEDVDVTGVGGSLNITTHPTSQTVVEGDLFTFNASATGTPAPTVQWQMSTDGGANFADIPGATDTTFSATAALTDNGNLYQAVFSNSGGSATTDPALLTVLPGDTTPPVAPEVSLTQDTGLSDADRITMLGDLTLGAIEVDALVEYSTDNGNTWSIAFAAAEGDNTVLIRQTDVAGNVGDATTFSFVLDTQQPSAPGVALTEDTGSSLTDRLTRIGALTLSSVEIDALVEYSSDAGGTWATAFAAIEGANAVVVHQIDVAGNVSDGTPFDFTLDTTIPTLSPAFSSASPFLVGAAGITVLVNASDANGIAAQSSGAVNTATPGSKVVTCTATDNAGNSASADLPYLVGYAALNVSPAAGSTFKKTAAIPVSFQLADANGLLSDQAAANLLPAIQVAFDGLAPLGAKYNKKTKTFSATLKTNRPPAGAYDVSIRVVIGGTAVTTVIVPVNIV